MSPALSETLLRVVARLKESEPEEAQVRAPSFAADLDRVFGRYELFVAACRAARARDKLVADAYHAALAVEHGCEWITADGDFARFPGLRWRHPLDGG